MKSERRHELKENELADWLEKSIDSIVPYTKAILGGIVAIVVAFLAYTLWQSQAAAAEQANWDQFYAAAEATDAEAEMIKVAEAHPKEAAGLWARLYAADSQLAEGTQNLFTNRAAARPKLREAAENYRAVAENAAGKFEPLVERAIYGEAKAYEALGEKSDLDAAQKLYQQLVEQFAGGALAADAEKRVADLKKPATKEFYDWFVKATPLPPPSVGTPGIGPAFDPSNVPTPPAETTTVEPGFDPFQQNGATAPPTDLAPADSGVPAETPPAAPQP